jgi:hypothetical protein
VKKTILIAPFEGPFAAALADEARAAGWAVLLARTDAPAQAKPTGKPAAGKEAAPLLEPAEPRDFAALPWNPSSYISTSSLFLAGKNALGELDAIVLLAESGNARPDLIEGRPGELEAYLTRSAAGPAFLVRETVRSFEARRAPGRDSGRDAVRDGALVFVDREADSPASPAGSAAAAGSGPSAGPAAALAAGAFRGLAEGVFAMSREASWEAFGVIDRTGDDAELARFVLRLLEAKKSGKSGRWLRHTGKSGLFGKF